MLAAISLTVCRPEKMAAKMLEKEGSTLAMSGKGERLKGEGGRQFSRKERRATQRKHKGEFFFFFAPLAISARGNCFGGDLCG